MSNQQGNANQPRKQQATYTGVGIALGAGIGVVIGTFMDNIALGIGIGVALGLAIGSAIGGRDRSNPPPEEDGTAQSQT